MGGGGGGGGGEVDQSELLRPLTARTSKRKDLGLSEAEKAAHLSASVASSWDRVASVGRCRSRRASARVSAFGFAAGTRSGVPRRPDSRENKQKRVKHYK